MTLSHRTTEVERIEDIAAVEDDDGNQQSPANTAEQQATQAAVDAAKSEIVAAVKQQRNSKHGNAGDEDGSGYPYTIDPAETIFEFAVPIAAENVAVEITTIGGDTFTIPVPSGGEAIFREWRIDSVTLTDPDGLSGRVVWWWAGK